MEEYQIMHKKYIHLEISYLMKDPPKGNKSKNKMVRPKYSHFQNFNFMGQLLERDIILHSLGGEGEGEGKGEER